MQNGPAAGREGQARAFFQTAPAAQRLQDQQTQFRHRVLRLGDLAGPLHLSIEATLGCIHRIRPFRQGLALGGGGLDIISIFSVCNCPLLKILTVR